MEKREISRALPEVDSDGAPYWEAASKGELSLCRCGSCGQPVHPPGPGCWVCGGDNLEWINLGKAVTGVVYTYVTVHRSLLPTHADLVPFVVVVCDVDAMAGARVMANLLNISIEDVKIGMPVEMIWEERGANVMVPQWIPRKTEG